MPLPKRRSPTRRKDRRERSRSRSFSPYSRREAHHHADDYHAYARPSHSRSASGHQGYHRSRTPIGHMTSASASSSAQQLPTRRHRYSPSTRHDVRPTREHPRRSFSPQPRHTSSLSSKQRSRSPMWSASRQVVPTIGSMEYAHSETSFKKSTQTFNESGRRSPPSNYCENPSTSSYSARKMSPSSQRFTSENYPPPGTPIPQDKCSRLALGMTYLQNNARCSLSERFKMFDPVESFHYDENITIGIHRGIQGPPGSPRPVRRDFNPYNFIMIRQKNEGSRPIFDREELRHYDENEEDADDFRVVTVAPTDRDDFMQVGATDSSYNVGYRSPPRPGGPPSYQWKEDQYGYNRHPRESFDSSRSFLGQSDSRERWISDSRMRPMGSPSHRYGGSESIYPSDRGEPRDWERLERVQHNPDDLRHSIGARYSGSSRKKSGYPEGSYYDREYDVKARESKYSKNSPEILPDFSKRPDKYQYEEWREHPEMVPRGSNYYEHDTRPEVDLMTNRSVGRFRSRGGLLRRPFRPFRSRGTFKPRLTTTYSSSGRRPFVSRNLGRFRTRSRGHISLRSRARGRGGGPSDHSNDDWKESSFSKSAEKQVSSDK